ncbi:MAG: SDR family NAD(P)-dependent oxidoreductase, partial [Rhodobacteraceae bacterium]|nr:SDR family NAD(P)-dependent oxidoreductase [Paracoccaceae bacterium]
MDLGIRGKRALVCASSQGLGLGCARALAAAGVHLVMNGRRAAPLAEAAEAVRREFGVTVTEVAADVASPAGQETLLAAA